MGRLAIFLEPINKRMPRENAMFSVSLIKQLLNSTDEEFGRNLFYYEDKSNKKIKDINTAIYISDFKNDKDDLIVNGDVIFNISFYSNDMYTYLYNGAVKMKKFEYKGYEFNVKRIAVNIENTINDNGVIFKTMSPIIIRNKDGRYLDVDDSEYTKIFNYITNTTLESIRGYGLKRPLEFIPLNFKKKVLKEKIRNFSEVEYYYINAYTGTFFLKGDVEDLNDLYKTGIGYRRTENAGMVEILK